MRRSLVPMNRRCGMYLCSIHICSACDYFFSLSLPFYELLNSLPLPTHNVIDKTVHRCNWRVSVRGSLGRPGSIVTGLPLFGGSATPCASPPPRPYVFLIILFGSTTLLTGMTGIFLHMQWPLTSQSHGSDSQREQLVFHYGSNSTLPGCLLNRCSRDFISLGQWLGWSKCPYVWVCLKGLTFAIWSNQSLFW
jgi:hypothetical protein